MNVGWGYSSICWTGTPQNDNVTPQIAYRYQQTDQSVYRDIGFVENVWVTGLYADNLATEVTYTGAVALTSAAGAIVFALLL